MKIVLLKTIPKIGLQGEVVEVSDGYAKNALIAKKLAVVATLGHIQLWNQKKQKEQEQKNTRSSALQEILPKLKEYQFVFQVKTGNDGGVFTSIHQEDIQKQVVQFLKQQNKIFDIHDVHIETKPIKELGDHIIEIRIGRGENIIKTTISIHIKGI